MKVIRELESADYTGLMLPSVILFVNTSVEFVETLLTRTRSNNRKRSFSLNDRAAYLAAFASLVSQFCHTKHVGCTLCVVNPLAGV